MNDSRDGFGERLLRLRRRKRLSQRKLGAAVGLSQPSVSRLEAEREPPDDLRLLSRVSQALGVTITELMEGFPFPAGLNDQDEGGFYAFCPNPFCERNTLDRGPGGQPRVRWTSGEHHPAESFEEVNYCNRCGEELVKECPSCKRRLRASGTRYCVACGTQVSDRPTSAEWETIGTTVPEEEPDDGLPF